MEKICRICLEEVQSNDIITLENIKLKMIEFLKVELNSTLMRDDPIICKICGDKLQQSFDFKTKALSNYDYLFSNHQNPVINLEEIVVRQNSSEDIKLEVEKICLLCLKYIEIDELTSLSNLPDDGSFKDLLEKCIPEIEPSSVTECFFCKQCVECLQDQFNFIILCFDTEELIKSYASFNDSKKISLPAVLEYVNKLKQDSALESGAELINIKKEIEALTTCVDLKSEPEDVNDGFREEHDEADVDIMTNNDRSSWSTLKNRIQFDSSTNMYACPYCFYKNHRRPNLASHLLVHEKLGNLPTFKCHKCNFESKWRSSWLTHQLLHKKSTEITMFKCYNCAYQTKYKKHLIRHMKLHEQRKYYSCKSCTYKTILKKRFKTHKCKDKDFKPKLVKTVPEEEPTRPLVTVQKSEELKQASQILISDKEYEPDKIFRYFSKMVNLDSWYYECNKCKYKTKKLSQIKSHVLRHLPKSEVTLEKCRFCDYQSKYKRSVTAHIRKSHEL